MAMRTARTRHRLGVVGGLCVAVLLLAGCGDGSDDTASTGSQGTTAASQSPDASQTTEAASGEDVSTGKTSAGTVLVDAKGLTLYAFSADAPGTSNCSGSCAGYWPPSPATGSPSQSSDVMAELGTLMRDDGSTQLTVNGWPAYTYAADPGPGQATGQGLDLSGGLWWVFSPSGSQLKSGGSSSSDGGKPTY